MADSIHTYGQIWIGSRGGMSQGQLKINNSGFTWKRAGGGKTVEIKKEDIYALVWTKNSRGCQLGVRAKEDGPSTNFLGFRDKDIDALRDFSSKQFGLEISEQVMSTSGRNWGQLAITGGNLVFLVDGKVTFEAPLKDVAQAQQAKDDVVLEFATDDTAGEDKEDVLMEMSFVVPPGNDKWQPDADEDGANCAKTLCARVLQHTETGGTGTSDDVVCSFAEVGVLAPRGRFEVEMHLSYLSLVGQTQDFKIRYTSIQRIFILPKQNTPHTLVVVSLDPPIRKGQTYYTHVLCQFPSDIEETVELDITSEHIAAKNEKFNGKLEPSYSGLSYDVFARCLRGLSGAKITRPGAFRNADGDGNAIRCSFKADDGHLYPLDRAFFYIQKPPMLVPFDEIESVEFARQGGGVVSSRTFDLVVRMKADIEHQFRNISRAEWQNLFEFISSRKIRIENLASAQQGPGVPGRNLVDEVGALGGFGDDEDSDEDEDFDGGASGSGDEDEESDTDLESGDAEMVAEEGFPLAGKKSKKRQKDSDDDDDGDEEKVEEEKPAKKAKASKKKEKSEEGGGGGGGGGGKEKKARKKKDPNAPKQAMSAFMFFSNDQRNAVKEANPGIAFGEVGKILGERWREMDSASKGKYDDMAAADKERYAQAMTKYKEENAGGAKEEEEED